MFKPDNEKLKSIVFHLLKKKIHYGNDTYIAWLVRIDGAHVDFASIDFPEKRETDDTWYLHFQNFTNNYIVDLSEKEAMEIKWQMEDLLDELEQNRLDITAEFALETKDTQDELLED